MKGEQIRSGPRVKRVWIDFRASEILRWAWGSQWLRGTLLDNVLSSPLYLSRINIHGRTSIFLPVSIIAPPAPRCPVDTALGRDTMTPRPPSSKRQRVTE